MDLIPDILKVITFSVKMQFVSQYSKSHILDILEKDRIIVMNLIKVVFQGII